jgi:competence protein ComEC
MNGQIVYYSIAALMGVVSRFEGIGGFFLFLLYLFGLYVIKKFPNRVLLLSILFYVCYLIVADFATIHNKTLISSVRTQFHIQFTDKAQVNGDRLRALATDTITKEKMIIIYKIPSEKEKKYFQQNPLLQFSCTVEGNLFLPSKARNENSFDYREYLKHQNIYWELHVSNWKIGSCRANKLTFTDKMKLLRIKGISIIEENFTKETAPIAAALIFGTRDLLLDEVISAYQKIGVIHLISISGLHVALIVGFIYYICVRLGFVRERVYWTLIVLLPFYSVLTGGAPSVNRAVMMTMIVLLVRQLKWSRKLKALDGLCVSFLFLCLWNPQIIYNIGFQLSYIVTFSLLLSSSIIDRYRSLLGKMVVTSYISQLSALPFLLFHFYELPFISIAANMIFIPLYSFIILPSVLLLFLLLFLSIELFQYLSIIISFLVEKSDLLAFSLSSLPWSRVIPGKPSFIFILLYTACIFITFFSWEKRQHIITSFILPSVIICAQILMPTLSSQGEVTVIDVGQGDSIFIKLPNNLGNYLIDTGGNISFPDKKWKQKKNKYEVGKDVIVPFLKSKGVDKLDLLILTHGDMDHIGGSLTLLKEIKVERILMPSTTGDKSEIEKELIVLAKKNKINISYVFEGMTWSKGNNEFFLLSPTKNYSGEKNDGSIVIHAKIGGLQWLFTGDLGKEGERKIIKDYPDITINVLKVGHHGSRTSTSLEFIEYYTPEYSIISVGEKNGFGHPHNEVLTILEGGGSKILRTDVQGGITYKFRGESGTFYLMIP